MRSISEGVPECWMWFCDGPKDPWWAARGHQQERWRGPGRFAHPRGWQGCGGQLSMVPPLPAAPEPGGFGAARAARGKRASGPGVSCFPLKCALDASAKRAHQTTDTSYGKPFLNCPGWLPTAQDSCQGSLLKMESYFHILLPAGRAPESCHFPICHWILHVSKSNPCLSPAGDVAQRSLESGLCLNINHPQACGCLSQHSSARGMRLMRGRK